MQKRIHAIMYQFIGYVILGSFITSCATPSSDAVVPSVTTVTLAESETPIPIVLTETPKSTTTPVLTATPTLEVPASATVTPLATSTVEEGEATMDAAEQYFAAVENNDIEMYIDAFHEDIELVVVSRTFTGHSGIEQFGRNEVLGGKYTILGQKQISENNVKILLEFTPRGWLSPEPIAVYDFTIEDNKIIKANLQYASQEDIDELMAAPLQDDLPAAFRCYLDGVMAQDLDATTDCFTDDAVVIDVGRRIEGKDAIRHWLDSEVMGLIYEVESVTAQQGGVVVIVKITFGSGGGGFRAQYDIDIENDLIIRMDLQYA